jgi:hypothetical protein
MNKVRFKNSRENPQFLNLPASILSHTRWLALPDRRAASEERSMEDGDDTAARTRGCKQPPPL